MNNYDADSLLLTCNVLQRIQREYFKQGSQILTGLVRYPPMFAAMGSTTYLLPFMLCGGTGVISYPRPKTRVIGESHELIFMVVCLLGSALSWKV